LDILVVEDDPRTGEHIRECLADKARAMLVVTGAEALRAAGEIEFDIAVVDRMLPDIDGIEVVSQLRFRGAQLPILLLTALGSVNDRVMGLDAGADDYLVKPFARDELLARIAALHRRPLLGVRTTQITIRDLEIDLLARRVRRGGASVHLQPREFDLLVLLAQNAGRPVTRKMFLERVWDIHYDPTTNIVESHISRLRAKLRQGAGDDPIETIQGVGYRIRAGA